MASDQPKRYRKRPVTIEAMGPVRPNNAQEIADWCDGVVLVDRTGHRNIQIRTLEGLMVAWYGDFVIRGVQGEFYPCKPDIFAATYEEAPDGAP